MFVELLACSAYLLSIIWHFIVLCFLSTTKTYSLAMKTYSFDDDSLDWLNQTKDQTIQRGRFKLESGHDPTIYRTDFRKLVHDWSLHFQQVFGDGQCYIFDRFHLRCAQSLHSWFEWTLVISSHPFGDLHP